MSALHISRTFSTVIVIQTMQANIFESPNMRNPHARDCGIRIIDRFRHDADFVLVVPYSCANQQEIQTYKPHPLHFHALERVQFGCMQLLGSLITLTLSSWHSRKGPSSGL